MIMSNSKGFSLVEVLVTLVITSLGILGMVVLQSNSIKYTQEIINKNNAVFAVEDLIGIIRTYRDEVYSVIPPKDGDLSSDGSFGDYYAELKSSSDFYTDKGKLDFGVADCPSDGKPQTAKERAGCWLSTQSKVLPGLSTEEVLSKMKICPSNSPGTCTSEYAGSTLEITIAWESKSASCGENGDSSICTYSVSLEL